MESMNNALQNACPPIGIFDSGVGGLSVCRQILASMPLEPVVYFADSANCPYGPRSQEEIIGLSEHIVAFLHQHQCKLIVVACNTATAMAIEHLRAHYPNIPFVGMEPAVKPAALESNTGVIGILATEGTFKGRLFNETKARFADKVKIIMKVGDGLVELVEQGLTGTDEARKLIGNYVEPMLEEGADHLVLGCTHYPFLIDDINYVTKGKIRLVDPAPAVAHRVHYLLAQAGLLCTDASAMPRHRFYTSGDPRVLATMVSQLGVLDYKVEQTNDE